MKTILNVTLKFKSKRLRHVSVQSHHHQGAHYSCLLKLHFVTIVNYGTWVCGDVATVLVVISSYVMNNSMSRTVLIGLSETK